MHRAQRSVLAHLRHVSTARFGELRQPTDMSSDIFKFHIQKLINLDYITKLPDGGYALTQRGKEFANRLDERTGREIPQPKASMLMIARLHDAPTVRYLAHRRCREPFRGFWGIGSAPILRGNGVVASAHDEFLKQTGIDADFTVYGVYRVIDRSPRGEVLEDKLFTIVVADLDYAPTLREWYGGENVWMTREELLAHTPLFPTTAHTLDMIESGIAFAEAECTYTEEEY